MSFSGHKLYAPKGIGLLYKKKGVRINSLIDGGAQEKKQRGGTENVAYAVALAKALEMSMADLEYESKRQTALRDRLIRGVIERIPHTKLNGHAIKRLPNNANFSFEFIEGESILRSSTSLGMPVRADRPVRRLRLIRHVLLAIGLPAEIAHVASRDARHRYDRRANRPFSDRLAVSR